MNIKSFPLLELESEFDSSPCVKKGAWANVYDNPIFGVESAVPSVVVIPIPKEKPPRRPTAYNVFFKETIARLQVEHPDMTHKERVKFVGKLWAEKKDTT